MVEIYDWCAMSLRAPCFPERYDPPELKVHGYVSFSSFHKGNDFVFFLVCVYLPTCLLNAGGRTLVCVCACACIWPVYMQMRMHACVCADVRVCMHVCMCASACASACVQTCICARVRVRPCERCLFDLCKLAFEVHSRL